MDLQNTTWTGRTRSGIVSSGRLNRSSALSLTLTSLTPSGGPPLALAPKRPGRRVSAIKAQCENDRRGRRDQRRGGLAGKCWRSFHREERDSPAAESPLSFALGRSLTVSRTRLAITGKPINTGLYH